ncbi:MAG: hypothetical protein ACSW8K_00895, partial [bacterium]
MTNSEITIVFDDYLRYRRDLLREKHKEAVMESFRQANPSAGPKAAKRYKKKQAFQDAVETSLKTDPDYLALADPALRPGLEAQMQASMEELEPTLKKYAESREKRETEKRLKELTGSEALAAYLQDHKEEYLQDIIDTIEKYLKNRRQILDRVQNTHFGKKVWQEDLDENNIGEFT